MTDSANLPPNSSHSFRSRQDSPWQWVVLVGGSIVLHTIAAVVVLPLTSRFAVNPTATAPVPIEFVELPTETTADPATNSAANPAASAETSAVANPEAAAPEAAPPAAGNPSIVVLPPATITYADPSPSPTPSFDPSTPPLSSPTPLPSPVPPIAPPVISTPAPTPFDSSIPPLSSPTPIPSPVPPIASPVIPTPVPTPFNPSTPPQSSPLVPPVVPAPPQTNAPTPTPFDASIPPIASVPTPTPFNPSVPPTEVPSGVPSGVPSSLPNGIPNGIPSVPPNNSPNNPPAPFDPSAPPLAGSSASVPAPAPGLQTVPIDEPVPDVSGQLPLPNASNPSPLPGIADPGGAIVNLSASFAGTSIVQPQDMSDLPFDPGAIDPATGQPIAADPSQTVQPAQPALSSRSVEPDLCLDYRTPDALQALGTPIDLRVATDETGAFLGARPYPDRPIDAYANLAICIVQQYWQANPATRRDTGEPIVNDFLVISVTIN